MKPRKRRKGNAERLLSILLAVVMVLSLAPENMLTLATYAEGADAGLCEHHRSHTADCDYKEAAPCTHEHTDECYTEKTSCVHEHDADCYGGELPAEGEDGEAYACTHVCTEDSGCVKKELNCTHEHDESCGYGEAAPCGYVCEICNGEETGEGQETPESTTGENSTEEKQTEGNLTEQTGENQTEENTIEESIAEESTAEESTAEESGTGEDIPEETIPEENISGEAAAAEEGLCPHHEQHTEDCGYGETDTCGYECKICPVQELINALPEAEEITTENAADMETQLAGIDEAKGELTDEERDALDTARYEAAVSTLLALEDMAGADQIQMLEGETGAFTVTGGALDTDYTYENNVLTVKTDTALTISGVSASDRIEVADGTNANITLNNVSIDVSGTGGAAAFKIADDSAGNVTVTLDGENTLKSGANCAGLQKNGNNGKLTIKGTGSLTAVGGGTGAGIGGSGSDSRNGTGGSTAHITIESGTIIAQGSGDNVPVFGDYWAQIGGAGIGGGANGSGTNITITGGTVKATGGGSDNNGGAGIGGGYNGSGTVKISGNADVTAQGGAVAAGIGAGFCNSIGVGHTGTVTIEGGTVIATGGTNSSHSGAGIGSGYSSHAVVTITGGTVTATGGSSEGRNYGGAGIGSSSGFGNATVKISGGTVIAKGGDDKFGGAGIGGGSSDNVNVTITGGMVTATGGSDISSDGSGKPGAGIGLHAGGSGSATFSTTGDSGAGNAFIIATGGTGAAANGDGITGGDNTSGWSGIIFQGNEGKVYGNQTLTANAEIPAGKNLTIPNGVTLTNNATITNNGTLTIDGGTLTDTGTLGGNGSFLTTELTEEMITVPTGLVYNADIINSITEQTKAVKAICGKEFTISGWTLSVTKNPDNDLEYTVTYTRDGTTDTVTKTVTVSQSGTNLTAELADNKTEYAYNETITINATVTPTGTAPVTAAKSVSRLRAEPTAAAGQIAVYEGDKQVCEPATPVNGVCTFNIPAKDLGAGEHTLIVKYIESTVMAEATVEANVLNVAECTHPTMDSSNKCTECEETIVAQVDGKFYTDFAAAWSDATANAEATLLTVGMGSDAIECKKDLTVPNGINLHLAVYDKSSRVAVQAAITVEKGGTLTLDNWTLLKAYDAKPALTVNGTLDTKGDPDIPYSFITSDGGLPTDNNYPLVIGDGAKVDLRYCDTYGIKVASGTIGDLAPDGFYWRQFVSGSGSDGGYHMLTEEKLAGQEYAGEIELWPVPVKIDTQPENATVNYGYENAPTLTVVASKTESAESDSITYQWYNEDETAIDGATSGTYTVPADLNAGEHKFYCAVTCDGYTMNSNLATVTVQPKQLTITGATLDDKIYDKTTTATVTGVTFGGLVTDESVTLGTDYTATAEFADANAGTNKSATVTVTLTNGNYAFADGKKEAAYMLNGQTINVKNVTNPTITLFADSFMWDNGNEIKPTVTITYTEGDQAITIPNTEYKVEYSGNTGVGEATVTVTGTGNYSFNETRSFTITCPHTNVNDGKCQICNESIVATVESGSKTTYYTDFHSAWNYANGKTATITMLQDQTVNEKLEMTSGNVTLTMASGVKLSGIINSSRLIYVKGGSLTLDGCTIESQDCIYGCVSAQGNDTVVNIKNCNINEQGGTAVYAEYSTVNIYSGTFKGLGQYGYGLDVSQESTTVNLYGGTFSGECRAISMSGSQPPTVDSILADGYCYKQGGTWLLGDALNVTYLTGTVEVKPVPVKITGQPTNISTTYGTASKLSVKAQATTEGNAITYQWVDESGNEISGATGETYSVPASLALGIYTYSCNVTCDGYTLKSNSVTVTVSEAPLPEVTLSQESVTYNGNEQKPTITVGSLTEGTDYEVSYTRSGAATTDFTNAGEITITVTGKGNYKDTAAGTFTIAKAPLTVTAKNQTITYGGNITQGTAQVNAEGLVNGDALESVTLTASSDQVAVADKAITPSTAIIKNGGTDVSANYAITYEAGSLIINKSQPTITFKTDYQPGKTYDGTEIPNPTAEQLTITGAVYSDVEFTWTKDGAATTPLNAGTYTLTATIPETDNTKKAEAKLENITISPRTVISPVIVLSAPEGGYVYDGAEKKPVVTVKDGETVIDKSEYTVEYSDNINVGTGATVKITDSNTNGNYVITEKSVTFEITAAPLTGAAVTVDGSYTYDGTAQTPEPKVTLGNRMLIRDTDYTVSYAGNVDAGNAAVTVTGKGNYTGEATGEFTIGRAVITDISATVDSVEAPKARDAVQCGIESGSGYTGEIAWTPSAGDNRYGFNTAYTAILTLTPDENHVFGEISRDGWSVEVSEDGNATLTKAFPATRKEKITSLDADAIGDVALTAHTDKAGVIAKLPGTVSITLEEGETAELPISWSCEDYDTAPNAENTFTWTVADVGGYDAGGVTISGSIVVTNPDALPVSITGTDREVVYNGSTIDVSELFTIDGNAGAASYSITGGTGEGTLSGSILTVTRAGTFTALVHTAAQGIYAAGTAEATLTVNKGTGTGSVTIEDWIYGGTAKEPVPESDTNGSGNVTYTYVQGDETVALPKDAGTYTVTAAFGETDLYNGCTASAEFTIAPKPVTVTITPNGGVYGGEITGATAVLNDVVTGDTAPTVILTYTGKANDGTEVNSTDVPTLAGTYTVTAGINSSNYTLIGTVTAGFRVNRAESSLTVAEVAEKTYGDEDFTLEVTADAGRDIRYVSSNPAVVTVDETGKVHIVSAGEAAIIVTLAEDANFLSKQLEVSVKIARKPVRVIAESAEVVYGEPVPDLSFTVTPEALVGGDALTGITVTRQEGGDAGEYTVTPAQEDGANPNYDVELVTGKLTIQPKDIENAEIVLGPALTANGREQTQTLESVTVKNSKGEDIAVTYTVTGNTAVNAGGYAMTITGTGNFTGTKEQSFAIAPGAGQSFETDDSGNPVLGTGKITEQVIPEAGAPAVDMGTSEAEIIELLTRSGCLTAQELAQVADGAGLKIIFTTSGSVSADDQAQIKSAADGYTIGSWFDISLYKQLGEGDIVWLHETGKPIRLTVQVPENLINTDKNVTRTFWVIRCHDGNAEFLPARYDDSSKTLSLETDRFSGYAIVYKDTKNTDSSPQPGGSSQGTAAGAGPQPGGSSQNTAAATSPKTGDGGRGDLWLAMMAAMSALGLGIVRRANRKKKRIY